MQAGKLDRRVQFLRAALVDDGYQQTQGPYIAHGAPVWAAKLEVSDAERFRAGTVEPVITTRFQVRWSGFTAGIERSDRLTCEGREYAIVGIKELGRREGLEISTVAT